MYVGIDHSTTGMKVSCIDDERTVETFRMDRRELEECDTIVERLDETIGLSEITLATLTYSYGNGISRIKDIELVSNRGVKDLLGLGYETGAGALVYDQLRESSIPTVLLPGVHEGLDTLHPFFKHYSTLSGADKVAAIRYALERVRNASDSPGTFIWACASSSCMSGLVCNGRLKGFFHWVGPVHGWPDPEAIRRGITNDFDDVFMQCGFLARNGNDLTDVHAISDQQLLEFVYLATMQNVFALYPFVEGIGDGELDAVVLSGRLMRREQPVDIARRVYENCLDVAPVLLAEPYAAAQGAALVARDVAQGDDHVLGIPVGNVPVHTESSQNGISESVAD